MTTFRLNLALLVTCPLTLLGADEDATRQAWQNTALGLFRDAHAVFATSASAQPSDREARLGEALTLLQLQPRTEARLRRSAELLDALLVESTTDEIAAKARYFRARLEHVHRMSPDLDAATRHYEKLVVEHPAHPLAGQAVVKLAILALYREQSASARSATFADFSRRAASLPATNRAALRDLHLALGEAALRFDLGDQTALDHFLAALSAGIALPALRADTLVRTAELARILGHAEIARLHYECFLAEFTRDPRRLTITERLAALPASASAAAAPGYVAP